MGLFKQKTVSSTLLKFLNTADDAYIKCFTVKNVDALVPYASNNVLEYVLEQVHSGRGADIGHPRYYHREWVVTKHDGYYYVYQKNVTHDNIIINKVLEISLGDKIQEIWKIQELSKDSFLIVEIAGLEGYTYG